MTSHKVCDKGDFPFNLNERTDVSPANGDCICVLNISHYSVHPLSLSLWTPESWLMLIWLAAPDWDHDLQIAAQIISNQGLIVQGLILLCYGFMIVVEGSQYSHTVIINQSPMEIVSKMFLSKNISRFSLSSSLNTKSIVILSCTCQNLIKPWDVDFPSRQPNTEQTWLEILTPHKKVELTW